MNGRRDDPSDALGPGVVGALKLDGCVHGRVNLDALAAVSGRVARAPRPVVLVVDGHAQDWRTVGRRVAVCALPRAAQVGRGGRLRIVGTVQVCGLLTQHRVQQVARAVLVERKRIDGERASRVRVAVIGRVIRVASVANVRHVARLRPGGVGRVGKPVHAVGVCIVIRLAAPALAVRRIAGKVVELKHVARQVAAHVPARVEGVRPRRGVAARGADIDDPSGIWHPPHALAGHSGGGAQIGVVPDLVGACRINGLLLGVHAARLDVTDASNRRHAKRVPRRQQAAVALALEEANAQAAQARVGRRRGRRRRGWRRWRREGRRRRRRRRGRRRVRRRRGRRQERRRRWWQWRRRCHNVKRVGVVV